MTSILIDFFKQKNATANSTCPVCSISQHPVLRSLPTIDLETDWSLAEDVLAELRGSLLASFLFSLFSFVITSAPRYMGPTYHRKNAAASTLAALSTGRSEGGRAGRNSRDYSIIVSARDVFPLFRNLLMISRTSCAVEVSNTKDISGTALRAAVETRGASDVGSWGRVAAVALDGVGHGGGGEESDE